jgi:N-acetylmuramoyl-L-alanine amidase
MLINANFTSPNFTDRQKPIEYIIVHFTEVPFEVALKMLMSEEIGVSAHYLIKEDGEIFQLVADDKVAWHAGKSSWKGGGNLNQNSIGIELDNSGNNKFSKEQINTCLVLSKWLAEKYNIPSINFIGHSDVAPDRKIDPGIFFDWSFFANHDLGIWHDVAAELQGKELYRFGDVGDEITRLQHNLSLLGYAAKISGKFDVQTNYIIRAFQSKFYPKAIHKKGLKFYNDKESKYSWDSMSDEMLKRLLLKLSFVSIAKF